jgi:hypothetical protein
MSCNFIASSTGVPAMENWLGGPGMAKNNGKCLKNFRQAWQLLTSARPEGQGFPREMISSLDEKNRRRSCGS